MLVAKPGMTVNWRAGEKENVRKGESEVGEERMCEQGESETIFSAKIVNID